MDDPNWPRDEYDCLIGPLITILDSGASDKEIGDFLRKEISDHFGLPPERYDFLTITGDIRAWFNHGWRDLPEPVTIYVALLDEGVDVWRPVRARPLGLDCFRIMGVEADVSDEIWQFPVGTIVRCVKKQFDDGMIGMTAIEQVDNAG